MLPEIKFVIVIVIFPIKSLCFFRLSMADNSAVGDPIWPKFELLLDIMHVLDTYKFKMDWINSNREKLATSNIFYA